MAIWWPKNWYQTGRLIAVNKDTFVIRFFGFTISLSYNYKHDDGTYWGLLMYNRKNFWHYTGFVKLPNGKWRGWI